MTLWTFVLLKYKYYIHHIISMIIYCSLGIASDFILGNFTILKYNYIIFHILNIIVEAFLMCYIKYLMDKCYYDYTETLIYYGLIGLITNFVFLLELQFMDTQMELIQLLKYYLIILQKLMLFILYFIYFYIHFYIRLFLIF